jgi:hypothetical protein
LSIKKFFASLAWEIDIIVFNTAYLTSLIVDILCCWVQIFAHNVVHHYIQANSWGSFDDHK